jgi:hypothetical protein
MRITIHWDETDRSNSGWYVPVTDGNRVITDSLKLDFPVDVDTYGRNEYETLRARIRDAFPDAEVM